VNPSQKRNKKFLRENLLQSQNRSRHSFILAHDRRPFAIAFRFMLRLVAVDPTQLLTVASLFTLLPYSSAHGRRPFAITFVCDPTKSLTAASRFTLFSSILHNR
jgi:hypothetical protein